VIVGLVAVGVVAVIALGAVSQTAAFRDWLRREVVQRTNAGIVGRLAIGRLDGSLFGRLIATDVRLTFEGQRVLAVRRLAAAYDVWTLIRGGPLRITALDLDGVALQLIADERGWNVERLAPPTPSEPERSLTVDVEQVRIADGAVRVIQPDRAWRVRDLALAGGARFAAHGFGLTIDRGAFLEQRSHIRVAQLEGRLAIDEATGVVADGFRLRTTGSDLTLTARVGPPSARSIEANVQITRVLGAELRALFGERAPLADWHGELRASGPENAVAVTGEVRAERPRDDATPLVGRVRLTGTLDVRSSAPGGEITADIDQVDLEGLVGPRMPPSVLTGQVRLTVPPAIPPAVRFALDLRAPRVGEVHLDALTLTGTADAETVRFEGDATAPGGAAHVRATIAPTPETYDLRLVAKDLDPGTLAGRTELAGRLNGTLTAIGTGFTPAATRGQLEVVVTPSHLGRVTIAAGSVRAHAESGRLVVEQANVTSNVGTADLAGEIALDEDAAPSAGGLRGTVRVTDLRPLGELLERPAVRGAGTLTIAAHGRPGAFDVNAVLAARGLADEGWRTAILDATFDGRRLGGTGGHATLQAHGRDVHAGERTLTALDLDATWDGDLTVGRGAIELAARAADAQHRLAGTLVAGAAEQRLTITALQIQHEGTTWTSAGTPTIVRRGERVAVDDLVVRADGGGGLRLRGTIGGTAATDLELGADDLDLALFAGLVPDDVRGRLGGRVHLGGTLAAPRVDADLAVAAPTLGGVRYDALGVRVTVADGRADVHGRLAQTAERALLFDGATPVQLALSPWRFEAPGGLSGRLRAEGIDLAFLGALVPGLVSKVGGTLTADVQLGGSLAAPEAHGDVALAGARAYVVPLGVTYDPVELALRLEGRALSIERLVIQSGAGTLTGGGDAHVGVDGTTMDARFEVKAFPLFVNQYGKGAASGWLWISGTLAAPVLEGSLETDGLVLQIPEVLPTSVQPPDPTIVVVGPGAPPSAVQAPEPPPPAVPSIVDRAAVTVQLAVPRNAWVRRSDANVELQGWMTAWKKPNGELHLAGDIRGVRGWYAFQGKKFTLVEGSAVRFSGQGLDPVLDITATHPAGEYLVRLKVGGTITKPALALESEPWLDQADVLAVLLFGAPASQLSRSQSTGLREQALGIAGGYVASELRQSVANALGVDDLQFDTGTTGLEDARVSVGKYVADDIFVSLAHRFGAQSVEEVRIEYVIRPGWSLETSSDTLGRSGVDLFWKRRY